MPEPVVNKNITVAQFIDGVLNIPPYDNIPIPEAESYLDCTPVQKYKRVKHNKRGPNCTGMVGAISELAVSAWLLQRGYAVYRNLAPVGTDDLVIVKDNIAYGIDVKTGRLTEDGQSFTSCLKTKSRNILVFCYEDNSIWFDSSTRLVPFGTGDGKETK